MQIRNHNIEIVLNDLNALYKAVHKRLAERVRQQSRHRVVGTVEVANDEMIDELALHFVETFKHESLLDPAVYNQLNNNITQLKNVRHHITDDTSIELKTVSRGYTDKIIIFDAMRKALEMARDEQKNQQKQQQEQLREQQKVKAILISDAQVLIAYFKKNNVYTLDSNTRIKKINELIGVISSVAFDDPSIKQNVTYILSSYPGLKAQVTQRYKSQYESLKDMVDSRVEYLKDGIHDPETQNAYDATCKVQASLDNPRKESEDDWLYYRNRAVPSFVSMFKKTDNNKTCDYELIIRDKSKSALRFAMVMEVVAAGLNIGSAIMAFASVIHSVVTRGHPLYMKPRGQEFAEKAEAIKNKLNIPSLVVGKSRS